MCGAPVIGKKTDVKTLLVTLDLMGAKTERWLMRASLKIQT